MTDTTSATRQLTAAASGSGTVEDYLALLKPRVMSLVVFTALVGVLVAPGTLHPWLAAIAVLAIAVGAGAAGALNMWYDADIDARMRRTASRPIPRGAIAPGDALGFGLVLAAGSVLVLGVMVNWASALLLAFTIFFYVVVYTMWLKRRTPQNIVIGGAAGAFPPMVGWAAVTGGIDLASIALFLIIFLWTPAHFWALALVRADDYRRAGVPMLPVVAGEAETRRQILVYAGLALAASALPVALGFAGLAYAAVAAIAGLVFLWAAIEVLVRRDEAGARRAARRLFGLSIVYLFALFAALLAEWAGELWL
jgi:protoheme IX farnesyltransferase